MVEGCGDTAVPVVGVALVAVLSGVVVSVRGAFGVAVDVEPGRGVGVAVRVGVGVGRTVVLVGVGVGRTVRVGVGVGVGRTVRVGVGVGGGVGVGVSVGRGGRSGGRADHVGSGRVNVGVGVGSPVIVGVGSPVIVGVGSPVIVGVGSPVIVGVGSPVIVGVGSPVIVGVGSPVIVGVGSPVIVGVGFCTTDSEWGTLWVSSSVPPKVTRSYSRCDSVVGCRTGYASALACRSRWQSVRVGRWATPNSSDGGCLRTHRSDRDSASGRCGRRRVTTQAGRH